jgi:RNA-directed DNA polymerase
LHCPYLGKCFPKDQRANRFRIKLTKTLQYWNEEKYHNFPFKVERVIPFYRKVVARMRGNSLQVNLIFWLKEKMEKNGQLSSWQELPWENFKHSLFHLQCKIYKAMRKNDIQSVIKLQKLLLNSSIARYIAKEEVAKRNLSYKLSKINEEQFFSNNNTRKFNDEDLITQYLWKMLLEPAHEAIFSEHSFGFRLGKNPWDIQTQLGSVLKNLSVQGKIKIIIIEIRPDFDTINYNFLIGKLICPREVKFKILKALQSGILKNNVFSESNIVVRGMLPSLFGNIVLDGIEKLPNAFLEGKNEKMYFGFRYGNQLIYILKNDASKTKLLQLITHFLKIRNLKISKKTIVDDATEFDFLGWHFFIQPTGKISTYPNKENWQRYKTKIKSILKNSKYKINTRINRVAIISREWHYYHQFCDMSKVKGQLYELKRWYSNYLRSNTKISKIERILSLRKSFNNYKYKTFGYTRANKIGSTFNGKWEDWDSEITNRQRQKQLYGLNLSSHLIAKIKLSKTNI